MIVVILMPHFLQGKAILFDGSRADDVQLHYLYPGRMFFGQKRPSDDVLMC
jgi:hypothetical protein